MPRSLSNVTESTEKHACEAATRFLPPLAPRSFRCLSMTYRSPADHKAISVSLPLRARVARGGGGENRRMIPTRRFEHSSRRTFDRLIATFRGRPSTRGDSNCQRIDANGISASCDRVSTSNSCRAITAKCTARSGAIPSGLHYYGPQVSIHEIAFIFSGQV